MILTFTHRKPDGTEAFNQCYEPELQQDKEFTDSLLKKSDNTTWVLSCGDLAGEIYGLTPKAIKLAVNEDIPDLDMSDAKSIYCYSVTVLPQFQGKGLGKIMFSYWLGRISTRFNCVVSHATSPGMKSIFKSFGFSTVREHENWFGSGRPSTFCRLNL